MVGDGTEGRTITLLGQLARPLRVPLDLRNHISRQG
jgi:hypothetical protein